MNLGLKYLIKKELDEELDNIFLLSVLMFKKCNGQKCSICGIVQGQPHKGWENYYCEHLEKEINKKLKEKKEKITKKIFLFTNYQDSQIEI
jgi:flavodoxin